jgi:peptidoglycan DL-endopeptidase CwlO
LRVSAVCGAVVTVLVSVSTLGTGPASADSVSSARAEAAQIAAQLQADQQRLDVASQQYDAAEQQATQIGDQISQTKASIATAQSQVSSDQATLRLQAINQYMNGSDGSGLTSFFDSAGPQAAVTQEYRAVATGNVSSTVDALDVAQEHLSAQEAQLQASEGQAQTALGDAAAARQSAEMTVASQQSTLAQETGHIASLVAQAAAAQAAAQHAAFEARVSQNKARQAPLPNVPASGAAGRAVAAAESQIGVPSHWGEEDPGHGFDCSGLTQWAWGQAGVGIPRTAQAQYDAITHVSLGSIEPGDLLFWGYGTGDIYHVGMYVGGGDIVAAPETGEDVQIQPIWGNDLVGAGRP